MLYKDEASFQRAQAEQAARFRRFSEHQRLVRATQAGYLLVWRYPRPYLVPMQPVSFEVVSTLRSPRVEFIAMSARSLRLWQPNEGPLFVPAMCAITTPVLALVLFVHEEYQARFALGLVWTLTREGYHPAQLAKHVTRTLQVVGFSRRWY